MRNYDDTREFLKFKRVAKVAEAEDFKGINVSLHKIEKCLDDLNEKTKNNPINGTGLTPFDIVAKIQQNTLRRQCYPFAKDAKMIYDSKTASFSESQIKKIYVLFHSLNNPNLILDENFPISMDEYIELLELVEEQENNDEFDIPLATIYKKILLEKKS